MTNQLTVSPAVTRQAQSHKRLLLWCSRRPSPATCTTRHPRCVTRRQQVESYITSWPSHHTWEPLLVRGDPLLLISLASSLDLAPLRPLEWLKEWSEGL